MKDFTFSMYSKFCDELAKSNHMIYTVGDFLKNKDIVNNGNILILRHDVDYSPEKALIMAGIEHKRRIKSTYYFRYKNTFNKNVILAIASMGHEIGYHYETLAKCKGDYNKAIDLFNLEFKEFKKELNLNIKTVCAHGSHPVRWGGKRTYEANYDIFKIKKDLLLGNGLLGEAYLDFDFDKVEYISDSQMRWNSVYSSYDLIEKLYGISKKPIYLLVHPDSWSKTYIGFYLITIKYILLRGGANLLKLMNFI